MTPELVALLVGIGVVGLFAGVIYFSLRYRDRISASNRLLRFADIKARVPKDALWGETLFGLFEDFSALECGFVVKNERDEEVGKIVYRPARRSGWMHLTCAGKKYKASTLNTWKYKVVFSEEDGKSELPLCEATKTKGFKMRIEIPGQGVLETDTLNLGRGLKLFTRDGKTVGFYCNLEASTQGPRVFSSTISLPLPIRMFLLALG